MTTEQMDPGTKTASEGRTTANLMGVVGLVMFGLGWFVVVANRPRIDVDILGGSTPAGDATNYLLGFGLVGLGAIFLIFAAVAHAVYYGMKMTRGL